MARRRRSSGSLELIHGPAFVLAPPVFVLCVGIITASCRRWDPRDAIPIQRLGVVIQAVLLAGVIILRVSLPKLPFGSAGAQCPDTHSVGAELMTALALGCGFVGGISLGAALGIRGRDRRYGFALLAILIPLVAALIRVQPELCDYT